MGSTSRNRSLTDSSRQQPPASSWGQLSVKQQNQNKMNIEQQYQSWCQADPNGCTNDTGHAWTGEVELEGQSLWFIYQDANGQMYESEERPAHRIGLIKFQYLCIPKHEAHLGLPHS